MLQANKNNSSLNNIYSFRFHFLTFLLVYFLIWAFSDGYLSPGYIAHLQENFNNWVPKPFVYRQFVPLICRGLMAIFNLNAGIAYMSVVTVTTLGSAYSLQYFFSSFWKKNLFSDLAIILGLGVMFLLIHNRQMKIYDTSTLFFFTLSLALIKREKTMVYLFLFPIICLNKETSILLTVIYFFSFKNKQNPKLFYGSISLQILIYFFIRLLLLHAFQNNEGVVAQFWPVRNLLIYLERPTQSIIFFTIIGIILLVIFKDWKDKPIFLRNSFILLGAPLSALYFFMGVSFEFRVFIEIFPLIFLLILPSAFKKLRLNLQMNLPV